MTLVASGQISIDDIRTEIGTTDGSLRALSSLAGKGTPDSLSEFYSYNAFSYYATWQSDAPCIGQSYDIYLRANGKYYADTGGAFAEMYSIAEYWYEFLYYDFWFDADVYNVWIINAASTVLTDDGYILEGQCI
jgi:hypothetical protein